MDAISKQADPKQGERRILDFVLEDLRARSEMGTRQYGTPLMTFNGRNALWDAYQEALDLVMYLRQALCERERDNPSLEFLGMTRRIIKEFAADRLVFHATVKIEKAELWDEYVRWCEERNLPPRYSRYRFFALLQTEFPFIRSGRKENGRYEFIGISMTKETETAGG